MGIFKKTPEAKEMKELSLQKIVEEGREIPREFLYREFADVFSREMLEQGFIQMHERKDAYTRDTLFEARLCVAPMNMTHVVIDDYSYFLDDMKFSQKELDEALRNTWPEKFL
jgi:hypothetical protein